MKFRKSKMEQLPEQANTIIDDEVFESATELQTVLKKFEDPQQAFSRTAMCQVEGILEPYTQLGRMLVIFLGQCLCSDNEQMKRKAEKKIDAIQLLAEEDIVLSSTREFPLMFEPEQNVCYLGDYENDEGNDCE